MGAGLGSLPLPLLRLALLPPGGMLPRWFQEAGFLCCPSLSLRSPPLIPYLSLFFCSSSVPPVFPSREPRTLTVTEGQPARLSCECRGIPFPKIFWRKDGMIASLAQPHPRCPCPHWAPPAQSLAGLETSGLTVFGVGVLVVEVTLPSAPLYSVPESAGGPRLFPPSKSWIGP